MQAIVATTKTAAECCRLGHLTGTLEPGKRADFCVQDCADWRELGYFFGVEHAHATYVEGRAAYRRAPSSEAAR
jgi:imidazolonepropionase